MPSTESAARRHLVTIAVEDYFQVGSFNRLIQRGEWYRFEPRVEANTRRALDLLDEFGVRGTFFVLGWIADTMPELIAEIARRGHEVASKGYYHRSMRAMTPGEFREDLARAREALRRASGQRVLGYRVADEWLRPADLWALDVLCEEGYEYDSSVCSVLGRFASEPWRRFAHLHQFGERTLWEFPISSIELFGLAVPVAGGNWYRQLPPWLVRRAVEHWTKTYTTPYLMYFHVWELDPDPPKISAASWVQRVRTYRNLDRMPDRIRDYLSRYRFTAVADHLGLAVQTQPPPLSKPAPPPAVPIVMPTVRGEDKRLPATIVIPCYNEELILPYLANTLRSVEDKLGSQYHLEFLFVDDESSDDTYRALQRLFGQQTNYSIVRHARNLGVAGAIATGIAAAATEIVCSIDCDCTYDPHALGDMISLLGPDVDLVTASPYHPRGNVRNLPAWRLSLSRSLSHLYRLLLRHKLYTYTSCFRVYRRSQVLQLGVRNTDFLGIAELLARLDLAGGGIVEFPATLQVRMLGRSKMRVLETILGHLGLMCRLALVRMTGRQSRLRPREVMTAGSVVTAPTEQQSV
jgi:polysaccharide deacetylase family protein (PEP-CTERM system associated)